MKTVIIYDTEAEALARTRAEGIARIHPSDTVSLYWWSIKEGTNGKWAVVVGDDVVEDTTEEVADSWFA